jgi:antitoxin ParD1/3/4
MNIFLTPQLEALVRQKVEAGFYFSSSDVIREALQLLAERDQFRGFKLEALRQEIALGIQQADQGEVRPVDWEAIKGQGRSLLLSSLARGKQ